MAIKVKFFASLREQMPGTLNQIDPDGDISVREVWLCATQSAQMPANVLCSVNLVHCDIDTRVSDGDEVAFFPPVTGG